jgi:plastocyanin
MQRTIGVVLGALVAATVLVACGGSSSGGTTGGEGSPTTGGGTTGAPGAVDVSGMTSVQIRTEGFSFVPAELRASPGQTLTIEVENAGGVSHTFTIEDLGIDEELSPGESVQVEVTLPDSGSVPFICRFHERSGMVGEITVS